LEFPTEYPEEKFTREKVLEYADRVTAIPCDRCDSLSDIDEFCWCEQCGKPLCSVCVSTQKEFPEIDFGKYDNLCEDCRDQKYWEQKKDE
jgi:hypothetical protein